MVSVEGKQPGTTHVVVITTLGVQTFEVLVTTPPPHYPPGFVMPVNVAELAQNGYYEDATIPVPRSSRASST